MSLQVTILDCKSGNLRSVAKAVETSYISLDDTYSLNISQSPDDLKKADYIIMPGQGAFPQVYNEIHQIDNLIETLTEQVILKAKPFLGICVGMQIMTDIGFENGKTDGLGWIPGHVVKIPQNEKKLKIPHMGWNSLSFSQNKHVLLKDITPDADVYFVHSYFVDKVANDHIIATVDYGQKLNAIIGKDNYVGTQFHPEKSHHIGLNMLSNFLSWKP